MRRVLGEMLAKAFQTALPSYHQSVPLVEFDSERCDARKMRTEVWNVRELSYEGMHHATIFGGDGKIGWTVCGRIRPVGVKHPNGTEKSSTTGRHCNLNQPYTLPLLHNVTGLLVFDYLIWNFNRFKWDLPPINRHWTKNVFVRLGTNATTDPKTHQLAGGPLAFIDNEFSSHSEKLDADMCQTFPGNSSFGDYVLKAAGYRITADASLGCPLPAMLRADLHRHGSGVGFADAVLDALGPSGTACTSSLWNMTFSESRCPALPTYLAARYDSLVVGLRAWGCR